MADLAAVASRTRQRRAVDDEPAPDAHRPPHEEDVVDAARGPAPVLREHGEIRLVGEGDRDRQVQRLGQSVTERLVAPAEVRRHRHHPVAPTDDADDRSPGSHEGGGRRQSFADGGGQLGERSGDVVDARAPARKVDPKEFQRTSAQPDGSRGQRIDGDLEREHDRAGGIGADDGRGPPRRTVESGRALAGEVSGDELPDEAADRATGQPGAGHEVGAGHRATLMELPDDGAQVRPTDRFAAMSELVATTQQGLCSSFSNVCARLVQPRGHVKTEDHGAVGVERR